MSSYILVNDLVQDNAWWCELIISCANVGDEFQIRCWADERAEIEQALSFGEKVSSSWHDGTVIKGRITRAFLTYLTKLEKPEADVYNKMTPFFTIRLGDVLSSEHYGTEIIISNPPDRAQDSIERILSAMEQLVVVHRNL